MNDTGALLTDRVALITGGSRGIGAACALRLAGQGADIVIADLEHPPEALGEGIRATGQKLVYVPCDVADATQYGEVLSAVETHFRGLNILVANAGINSNKYPVEEFPVREFDALINTNLRGTFLTLKAAVPFLKKQGGSIILMSSVNGIRTFHHPGNSIYSATKAAITAFGKSLAVELAPFNIRVNMLSPGKVRTGIDKGIYSSYAPNHFGINFENGSPMLGGGVADSREVADACLFYASDLSRHVTGDEMFVDGGQSLLF